MEQKFVGQVVQILRENFDVVQQNGLEKSLDAVCESMSLIHSVDIRKLKELVLEKLEQNKRQMVSVM